MTAVIMLVVIVISVVGVSAFVTYIWERNNL